MEVRDPAAVFSLEGLKLFIEVIKNPDKIDQLLGNDITPDGTVILEEDYDSPEVLEIVQEYNKSKGSKFSPEARDKGRETVKVMWAEKARPEVEAVESLLRNSPNGMRTSDIASHMKDFDWSISNATTKMKKIMRYSQDVVKSEYGMYKLLPSNTEGEGEE